MVRKRHASFTFNHSRRIKGRLNYYHSFTSVNRLPADLLSGHLQSTSLDISSATSLIDRSHFSVDLLSLSILSRSSNQGILPSPFSLYTYTYVCVFFLCVYSICIWLIQRVLTLTFDRSLIRNKKQLLKC